MKEFHRKSQHFSDQKWKKNRSDKDRIKGFRGFLVWVPKSYLTLIENINYLAAFGRKSTFLSFQLIGDSNCNWITAFLPQMYETTEFSIIIALLFQNMRKYKDGLEWWALLA